MLWPEQIGVVGEQPVKQVDVDPRRVGENQRQQTVGVVDKFTRELQRIFARDKIPSRFEYRGRCVEMSSQMNGFDS